MKTKLQSAVVLVAALCPLTLYSQALGLRGSVGIWGVQTDTPEWNTESGVAYTRQGCPDAPASCMAFTGRVAASNNVKVSLVIPLNLQTPAAAQEYSRLSANSPFLAEVSIDDFVSQYKALFGSLFVQPSSVVAAVIGNLKSANPRLKFGATIYEDDLSNAYLQDARLPAAVRNGFDVIHLFLHYREDGPSFTTYVQAAKRAFPNAVVIAGSYAVDRRAFLPCAPSGSPCTPQQEYDLFVHSIMLQVQLMRQGAVTAIEFFPGYFGLEEQWAGWSNPRECAPGDLTECIANTKRMREFALAALNQGAGLPVWKEPFPTGPLPASRYGHSAAMDSATDRMIVFGGTSASGVALNDTWILTHADGQGGQPAWLPVSTATAPPAVSYSPGMYDPNSNRMILYGGALGNDIWVLTNANGLGSGQQAWIQLVAVGNPPPYLTNYEKQVYDPISNVLMVFDSTAGVWVLSNANGLGGAPGWRQLNVPANGPSGRRGFTARPSFSISTQYSSSPWSIAPLPTNT